MNSRDSYWMGLALQLARLGQGYVEPNPMVGCVIVRNDQIISSGYHHHFGGPHAEVDAIQKCPDSPISGATVYVTLEPCSHYGKTPPCVELLLGVRPARVVVAMTDPFPKVAGKGIAALRDASIPVDVGVCEDQAKELNAPYLKLIHNSLPWVIAKWAMSLDGAIACSNGTSKWISNPTSRRVVHELRSRVDAIVIGSGTAVSDNPMLTARLDNKTIPRIASRIVVDRACRLPLNSHLIESCHRYPLMIATVDRHENAEAIAKYEKAGCEVFRIPVDQSRTSLPYLLKELGKRRFTNVLIEGGQQFLGAALDDDCIDEVHCFVAPMLIGGQKALRPIGGLGSKSIDDARKLGALKVDLLDGDTYIHGRIR